MKYASIPRRVRAVITDQIIQVLLLFALSYILEKIGDVSDKTRMFSFLSVFILYEPIFVSLFGGTIGHMSQSLTVKKAKNENEKIFIVIALFRYIIKILLGWLSLISISEKNKNRAIHDFIAGSVVIIKDTTN